MVREVKTDWQVKDWEWGTVAYITIEYLVVTL